MNEIDMTVKKKMCSRLIVDEQGQDLIEYGLLAALISVVAVLAISAVGLKVNTSYENIGAGIP